MNEVNLIGRICTDTNLKTTAGGNEVCSFRLAVDRRTKEKETDFIPCVAWGQTATFISRWFAKGQLIALNGSIQSRQYEDRNGQKREAHEVRINHAEFCGAKQKREDFEELTVDEPLPWE